jgi:type IV pilus assembly protein PilB
MSSRNRWLCYATSKFMLEGEDENSLDLPENLNDAWVQVKSHLSLTDTQMKNLCAEYLEIAPANLKTQSLASARFTPAMLAKKFRCLPFRETDETLTIAICQPNMDLVEEAIRFGVQRKLEFEFAAPTELDLYIGTTYSDDSVAKSAVPGLIRLDKSSGASGSKMADLFASILRKAIEEHASDIHIQSFAGSAAVRTRVDGLLRQLAMLPALTYANLTRYLKVVGSMDVTETRRPQDGRASAEYDGRKLDLRISFLPSRGGESIVIRVLEQSNVQSFRDANFSLSDRQTIESMLQNVSGVILFTGPTGSGKTSTLYSILSDLNNFEQSIVSVEDPVEYTLPGIVQVDVDAEHGRSFPDALRSILRQDPDTILIGEIRDPETALVATQAAITGHLVLSTLHTSDALGVIQRLVNMGVDASIVADALVGVVSQRLLRKLCPDCKATASLEELENLDREFFNITQEKPAKRPVGCAECGYTGYKGRIPIVETLNVNAAMRACLSSSVISRQELQIAAADDLTGISLSAANWIVSGETSVDEAFRVLGHNFWNQLCRLHGKSVLDIEGKTKGRSLNKGAMKVIVCGSTNSLSMNEIEGVNAPFEFLHCDDPSAARKLLEANPDIVAMIIDLDGKDDSGVETLQIARSELAWAGIPALLIVDEADDALMEVIHEHQVADYLLKPADENRIISAMHSMLNRGG